MKAQRAAGTKPEMALRRRVHAMGLRYLVDAQLPLPGLRRRRADLLFRGARVAVFVDGCYWHACPAHSTKPKSNAAWWEQKLATNVARDRDTDARLAETGWTAVRVWEHEDPDEGSQRVAAAVYAARASQTPRSTRR